MDVGLHRSSTSACLCLLGGCAAEVLHDESHEDAGFEGHDVPSLRLMEPSLRCDGAPLPACDGPFTGAACNLPCLVTYGEASATCGLDVYCHSDGAVYGLATRNAVLFRGEPDDDESIVESSFEQWIVEHAADLGLESGLEPSNLELHRLEGFRSAAGPLTIFRFSQTYDSLPVLAPDGIVTLVYGPQGAVSVTGAIIDGRVAYEHRLRQASKAKAESSMLTHASTKEGIPADELEVVHATRVAMPMAQAIGWVGFVRKKGAGAMQARVIVDADPVFPGAVLPLTSYRKLTVSGLKDTQPIQVRALDPAGEPETLAYAVETMLTTGAPLVGSVDDVSSEIQLADERVVVLDMHGGTDEDLHLHATRILDPAGVFLADAGPGLSAQVAYHIFQSWYDLIDGHLTDPLAGAKRWDSANLLYTNSMTPSDTPPGTFSPRVLVFSNISSAECPVDAAACMDRSGYRADNEPALTFPELAHVPTGASNPEVTGSISLPGDGIEPVTFAHEFGHVIDLFTGGGITWDFAPDCGVSCSLECVENTSDEAPPLSESIAQLLAFVFLRHSFEDVGFDHCPIVPLVSRNGTNPWTPGACIPPGEDISLFERVDTCSKPPGYCDKPETAGFERDCCFDDEDLTECTIEIPDECPVGEAGPGGGGMGTGTARVDPTGLCDHRPGYRTNSLYQAFWQLLNGQRCEPTAPFACVSAAWPSGVDPTEATTAALLYAMRINALTYEELFDGMATYVSCTHGAAAYEEFNAVVCNHGIRDCTEPAPMVCEDCGNGVREGGETCDGNDWLLTHCEDDPLYDGGTLTCDQNTCQLDHTQCTMPGLDTTAGTMSPEGSSTSASVETHTETDVGAAGSDPGGCSCRVPCSNNGGLLVLSLSLLGAVRRRRSA